MHLLTFLCLICRCVLCLGLRGHQDLDRKAKNIWTIKLKREIKTSITNKHYISFDENDIFIILINGIRIIIYDHCTF